MLDSYHAGNTGSGDSRLISATSGQHATTDTPVTKPIPHFHATDTDLLEAVEPARVPGVRIPLSPQCDVLTHHVPMS